MIKHIERFTKPSSILLIVAIVLVVLSIGSCKKDSDPANSNNNITPIPASDVAGYCYKGDMRVAKYWKDGVGTELTDGVKDAQILGISVSGSDVFLVGVEKDFSGSMYDDQTKMPRLWKNGSMVELNVFDFGVGVSKNTNGVAKAVQAVNGTPYVAGYMSDGGLGSSVATLWVNGGTPQPAFEPVQRILFRQCDLCFGWQYLCGGYEEFYGRQWPTGHVVG